MKISAEIINRLVLSGLPFVIYRFTGEKKMHVKTGVWERKHLHEIKKSCFFIQPFSDKMKGFALNESIIKKEKIINSLVPVVSTRKNYSANFRYFHSQIISGKADKLVLSKVKKGSEQKINIGNTFINLCRNYPKATVNLFFIPNHGLWMGATPELLLKSDLKNTISMSLAGTLEKGQKSWTNKEHTEQRMVTEYILKKFKSVSKKITQHKTETIKAGNVYHLCNRFSLKENLSWSKLIHLIGNLHPTPAVCGLPLALAKAIILQNEPHQREFYSGYLGTIEPGKSVRLFVNLRCMKIADGIPYIFTGGGLTSDSVMIKEWNETELKAKGLINSLSFGEN